MKCGKALSFVLDAIQKMSAYDDDQFLCHMLRDGRKVERPNLEIPLSCLETRESKEGEWKAATHADLQTPEMEVRTNATFAEHGHQHLHHRPVEVVHLLNGAINQMEHLQNNLKQLATEWSYCFTDEAWTPYLHVVTCHTMKIMSKHKRMGQFSQQVVENFHKLVRWFYARTNREGGNEEHVVESSMNIMQLFWGQKLLEMESRQSEYNQAMVAALREVGRIPLCNCTGNSGLDCGWQAVAGRTSGRGRGRDRVVRKRVREDDSEDEQA